MTQPQQPAQQADAPKTARKNTCPLCAFAVFLTFATTFVLSNGSAHLLSLIPNSAGEPSTVPVFNAWTFVQNATWLGSGRSYWDGQIFSPEQGTFAFSEPQPATIVVAPVYWMTGSAAATYNAYLILSLTLNGFFAWRLLRHQRTAHWLAVAGSVSVILLPISLQQRDVIQLIPVWGILWTWDALFRLKKRPTIQNGIHSGLAVAATFYLSVHHGLFLSLITIPAAGLTFPWKSPRRWLPSSLIAMVTTMILVGPLLLPMRQILNQQQFSRTPDVVASLSARPADYLATTNQSLIQYQPNAARLWYFNPGFFRTLAAVLSVLLCCFISRRRNSTIFLILIAILAFALSLGVNLKLGPWSPWQWLVDSVPGFAMVRSPFRFCYFYQLAMILLGASSLDLLWRLVRMRWRRRNFKPRRRGRLILNSGLLLTSLLFAVEVPPARGTTVGIATVDEAPDWLPFVSANRKDNRCVLCLPYAPGSSARDFELTCRWMLFAKQARVPLMNGYSGFFPQWHFDFQQTVNESPWSENALTMMREHGVQFIVVHNALMGSNAVPVGVTDLTPVLTSKTGTETVVYELGEAIK